MGLPGIDPERRAILGTRRHRLGLVECRAGGTGHFRNCAAGGVIAVPYALVVIGLIMIITGILNTYAQLATQLQSDFTGNKSFIVWIIALGSVGALGYIKDLRTFSHYFMALILIGLVLSNKGFFANFTAAIKAGPSAPTASAQAGTVSQSSSTATINGAITSNQQGVGGSTPATSGQAKFNGWMNYFFGTGTTTAQ